MRAGAPYGAIAARAAHNRARAAHNRARRTGTRVCRAHRQTRVCTHHHDAPVAQERVVARPNMVPPCHLPTWARARPVTNSGRTQAASGILPAPHQPATRAYQGSLHALAPSSWLRGLNLHSGRYVPTNQSRQLWHTASKQSGVLSRGTHRGRAFERDCAAVRMLW